MGFIYYEVIKLFSIYYGQKEKNMTSFLKFVYIMVIFLSLFLFATDVKGMLFFHPFCFSYSLGL